MGSPSSAPNRAAFRGLDEKAGKGVAEVGLVAEGALGELKCVILNLIFAANMCTIG